MKAEILRMRNSKFVSTTGAKVPYTHAFLPMHPLEIRSNSRQFIYLEVGGKICLKSPCTIPQLAFPASNTSWVKHFGPTALTSQPVGGSPSPVEMKTSFLSGTALFTQGKQRYGNNCSTIWKQVKSLEAWGRPLLIISTPTLQPALMYVNDFNYMLLEASLRWKSDTYIS